MKESVEYRCEVHPDFGSCHDYLFDYSPMVDEYQLLIHDGELGGSETRLTIDYCPFCGTRVPPSRRDERWDRLEALGREWDQAPDEMNRYGWWLQT